MSVERIAGVGRPRLLPRQRDGDGGRQEILDAASQLFTENGFSATSTRAIAVAVGIKQASLYYYFDSKEQLLVELLSGTVQPSLVAAGRIARSGATPEVQLHALATLDVDLLCSGRWNLGALYLLPELRSPRFAEFQTDKERLKKAYGRIVASGRQTAAFPATDTDTVDLVFALVEAVISLRSDNGGAASPSWTVSIPHACLRVLGVPSRSLGRVQRESAELRRRWPTMEA